MPPYGDTGMQSGDPAPALEQASGTHRPGPHGRVRQEPVHQLAAVLGAADARKVSQPRSIKRGNFFLLHFFPVEVAS